MRFQKLFVAALFAAVAAWSVPSRTFACPSCDQHAQAGAAKVEAKDAAACTEGCCDETCKGNCPMAEGKDCPHAKNPQDCPHAKSGDCPHAKEAPADAPAK